MTEASLPHKNLGHVQEDLRFLEKKALLCALPCEDSEANKSRPSADLSGSGSPDRLRAKRDPLGPWLPRPLQGRAAPPLSLLPFGASKHGAPSRCRIPSGGCAALALDAWRATKGSRQAEVRAGPPGRVGLLSVSKATETKGFHSSRQFQDSVCSLGWGTAGLGMFRFFGS